MTSSKGKLLRIVIDTNLFVSGLIIKNGYPSRLLSHWRKHSFILLTSDQQREELIDVLTRPKILENYHLSKKEIISAIFLLDTTAIRLDTKGKLPVEVRDPKDEKILAIALRGNADYLVTGDEDLLILNGNPSLKNLKIITVKAFLNLF